MSLANTQAAPAGSAPASTAMHALQDVVMEAWDKEVRARVEGAFEPLGPAMAREMRALFDRIALAVSNETARYVDDANRAGSMDGYGGVNSTVEPDQIAHEYQIFRETLAHCTNGRVELNADKWRLIDQMVNAAMRESLGALARIQKNARQRVAAALSHDMRTPLAVIANGARLISITSDMNRAKSVAAKIESNATRLSDMLADLLDAFTFQGGARIALRLSRFDAFELAQEVRDQFRQGADWDIQFEAEGAPVFGYWCRDSLRRALENLINNAVKYGAGGVIRICARENRNRLLLSVHNDGAPIPEGKIEGVFDYLRRERGVASISGWGIGLPFVKTVAESQGGGISVDSAAERGTTFFVDLPLDSRPYVDPSEASA